MISGTTEYHEWLFNKLCVLATEIKDISNSNDNNNNDNNQHWYQL